ARSITVVLGPSPRAFQAFLALLVLALTGSFAVYCFARAPFSQDEMAQRFHAHVLLAGRLFAAGEPHPEFFSITGVLDRAGRWYSMYPIGGPALLAVGAALHATWLVNPVLTAFTACALYRFAAAAFGEGPGRASALLFALSPFVLIMGASEMNHVGALALATLALAALPTWATSSHPRAAPAAAALIGLGVGGMATIRPLDGAAVAAVVGLFQHPALGRVAPRLDRRRGRRVRPVLGGGQLLRGAAVSLCRRPGVRHLRGPGAGAGGGVAPCGTAEAHGAARRPAVPVLRLAHAHRRL